MHSDKICAGQREGEYWIQVVEQYTIVSRFDGWALNVIEAIVTILCLKLLTDQSYKTHPPNVVFVTGDKVIIPIQALLDHDPQDIELQ